MKTIKVITTVGTSVFSNGIRAEKIEAIRVEETLTRDTNYYTCFDDDFYKDEMQTLRNETKLFFEAKSYETDVAAEIKSLILIQQEQNCKLEVYLICTDTLLSVVAADMIKEFFEGKDGQGGYDPNKEKFVIKFEHNEKFIMENDIARFISYGCDVFNVTAGDRQWAVQCAIKNAKNTICLSERQLTQFVSNSTSHYSNGCWDSWYDWS